MKRAAIFTLQGLVNYGNRLQNYAVERLLIEHGYQVDSIVITNYPFLKPCVNHLKRIFRIAVGSKHQKIEAIRQEKFWRFNKRLHLKHYKPSKLSKIDNYYDIAIVGSDQVWNPRFNENNTYLLPFLKNKISLSASFGVSDLSDDIRKIYKQELRYFKAISVRENDGKELVSELLNEDAVVLIDPTMVITKEEWEQIEIKPLVDLPEQFFLSYTLGSHNEKRKKIISEMGNCYNIKHIELFDDLKQNEYAFGPEEFIWLIHHASFVVTDSFHATVFSILFHTPFIVFERSENEKSMNSRFKTLLSKFGLESNVVESLDREILKMDFEHCEEILGKERKAFMHYLTNISE